VARADSGALGGSLPCVVDWLPAEPHDLLAVGCWDGTVAVFQLTPGEPQPQQQQQQQQLQQQQQADASLGSGCCGLRLLSHFAADSLPLRVLRWVPPGPCSGSIDLLHRHIIFTAGHEGCLRIWDLRCAILWGRLICLFWCSVRARVHAWEGQQAHASPALLAARPHFSDWRPGPAGPLGPLHCSSASRTPSLLVTAAALPPLLATRRDPFQPLYSHTLSSAATILGGAWTERPFGIMVCMEDASVRGTVLDSGVIDRGAELGAQVPPPRFAAGTRSLGWLPHVCRGSGA
jgi:hypothetical protein